MAARTYDPLTHIPSPEVIRRHLAETETLAERLRILLDVAERLRLPLVLGTKAPATARTEEVRHAR